MGMLAGLEMDIRLRWAIENLTESEGLTADLSDKEARILLAWGISQAELMVDRTAGFAPDRAAELLEGQLTALRKLMRGMNKLTADARAIEQDRLERRLIHLQETAGYLGLAPEAADIESVTQNFSQLPDSERLARLIQLFSPDTEFPAPPEETVQ